MSRHQEDSVSVLQLSLNDRLVGYLSGFQNGRNVVTFAPEFIEDYSRPTFSLITHPSYPHANKLLSKPWAKNQRLHPVLSNLLPEGALRELLSQNLKTHIDNEFQLFSHLGHDLPGALIAKSLPPESIPQYVLGEYKTANIIQPPQQPSRNKFSLAGVQMKFSMKAKDGRYQLSNSDALGNWIVKTPSTKHALVPFNEYTAMTLAALAGITIPEIKLVRLDQLDHLPAINLPDENFAFAIKRFDRSLHDKQSQRIHMEDFAQVLAKYPHDKYNASNYESVGRIIYQYAEDGLGDVQQFARRLLVNILLANGDAHLKNWSLLYPDTITPQLSPAYDIVTTRVYMGDETDYALNMARTKQWYKVTMNHFENWANRADIPWRAIKPQLIETLEKARSLWPTALDDLPMSDDQKIGLKKHWQLLQDDFAIKG